MPDMALLKFVTDIGAWALSLLAIALVWLHNRDDKIWHAQFLDLEKKVESIENLYSEQKTANRLSAQADATILAELAKVGQRIEAVSTRVDSIDRTTVELKTEVRHYAHQTETRRDRS